MDNITETVHVERNFCLNIFVIYFPAKPYKLSVLIISFLPLAFTVLRNFGLAKKVVTQRKVFALLATSTKMRLKCNHSIV